MLPIGFTTPWIGWAPIQLTQLQIDWLAWSISRQ